MTPIDWPVLYAGLLTARLEQDTRIRRVRMLVDSAYAEPLDAERLATEACLSRAQLIRAFRQAYGTTPHQYLIERRVAAARTLLEQTELPVTEVCLAVGFSSLGSFSTLFRRHVGRAPQSYRRLVVPSLGLPAPLVPACFALRFGGLRLFEKSSPADAG
ncbi:MAG: helix-turn-helix transcriptional regulator [Myxococcales bacterium]|nr:helix-turn-helix transcriptional regulator [Myxococcales bacterium]MCB9649605.1 helix-turn-helix transcriptional regulator [Deltaproteobacteria bacterium]